MGNNLCALKRIEKLRLHTKNTNSFSLPVPFIKAGIISNIVSLHLECPCKVEAFSQMPLLEKLSIQTVFTQQTFDYTTLIGRVLLRGLTLHRIYTRSSNCTLMDYLRLQSTLCKLKTNWVYVSDDLSNMLESIVHSKPMITTLHTNLLFKVVPNSITSLSLFSEQFRANDTLALLPSSIHFLYIYNNSGLANHTILSTLPHTISTFRFQSFCALNMLLIFYSILTSPFIKTIIADIHSTLDEIRAIINKPPPHPLTLSGIRRAHRNHHGVTLVYRVKE
eukprot:gene15239-18037_t